jgi:hypothetical protein
MSDTGITETGDGFLQGVDPQAPPPDPAIFANGNVQQEHATIAPPGYPPGTTFFTQADLEAAIERVRKEEKDKLYPTIDRLKEQMGDFQKEREEREAAAQAALAEAEAERKTKEEEQMELRQLLDRRDAEWQQRFHDMEEERDRERAVLEQERRYNAVQEYRRNRIEQEGDSIMPELRDLVTGSTEEEIETSIAVLREKTSAIFAEAVEQLSNQQLLQPQQIRGVGITSPPNGPLEQESAQRSFSPEDIRKMSMEDYAKYRESLQRDASLQYRGY